MDELTAEMLAMPSPLDELRERILAYATANGLMLTAIGFSEDRMQLIASFRPKQ